MFLELVPRRKGFKFGLALFSGDEGRSPGLLLSLRLLITVPNRRRPNRGRDSGVWGGAPLAEPDRRAPSDEAETSLALSSWGRDGVDSMFPDAVRLRVAGCIVGGAPAEVLATKLDISSLVSTFSIAFRQLSADMRLRST